MGWQRRGVGVGEMRGSQLHNSHRTSSVTATSHNSFATTTLIHLSRVDIEDSTPLQSPISVFNVRMWMHLVVMLWWPHSLYYHLTMFNSFQLYFAFSGNSFLSHVTAAIQNHPSLICHSFYQWRGQKFSVFWFCTECIYVKLTILLSPVSPLPQWYRWGVWESHWSPGRELFTSPYCRQPT